jgi:chemotaxis receptor (MCP) glutamine deamidase CheD
MKAPALILLLAAVPAGAQPVTVGQDQFAAARAFDHPAVRTFQFSTCVAVFLYDEKARIGAVGHVAASTNAAGMVEGMLAEMRRLGSAGRPTAQLFGGWNTAPAPKELMLGNSTSPQIVADIKAALKRRGILVTREETLTIPFREDARGIPPIRSVSMDLATGVATDYQP